MLPPSGWRRFESEAVLAAWCDAIRPVARRITLYGSEADWALVVSQKLHGDAPRAGQGGDDAMALAEVDTVDMSEMGEDMLAHSYIANDSSVLLDLVSLFWKNLSPPLRCGVEAAREESGVTVWKYVPGQCSDNVLIGLLATFQHERADTSDEIANAILRIFGDSLPPEDVSRVVQKMGGPS